ncbi:MAG: uL15 family ribosomal protein [Candidatus Nanoarchaeia archaeon]|nr:uL15 family ribosomal protein [Candidatus Nanoarchaeia archaeon]MDD5741336.1 uL15 family ribosomal protein [Candidatus Nanoarchaeia archaeon]
MEISKTRINERRKRKTNSELVETIGLAQKNNLSELARKLSAPRRLQGRINLDNLNKIKEDKIMIVGKVLGLGDINKKITISALGFSGSAVEKLKKKGCEIKTIKQEIERNKKLEGVKII